MTIYALDHEATGYVELRVVRGHDSGYKQQESLTSTVRLSGNWIHPPVEFNRYDWRGKIASRKKHPEWYKSDAPGNNYLSGRAAEALRDLWEEYGELLPLPSKDGEFYVYHCTNQIDAVDAPRCEFNGTNVVKYAFRPEVVGGRHIFRPSFPWRWPIFVSQLVVDRVQSAGLKGFRFTPVWNEERGPIAEEMAPPAVERPRHIASCKPLPMKMKRELEKLVRMAKKEFKIDVSSDPPERVLECIGQEVHSAQGWANRFDEGVGVGMVLGSLWGALVCREFGWQWAVVDGAAAVVSPTRSHVVFPHTWLHDLIRTAARGPKLAELYGMIKSGSLPPSEPDACVALA